jgi:hypothetical protein
MTGRGVAALRERRGSGHAVHLHSPALAAEDIPACEQ